MTWGEVALFFGRLSRGGKNVKGYGSINDVLMRCNIAPKLFQMAIPDHGQHRRVRLHGMIALVRMSEDPMLCTPILMSSGVTIQLCLDIATNERESDSMRRQALLLLRKLQDFQMENTMKIYMKLELLNHCRQWDAIHSRSRGKS